MDAARWVSRSGALVAALGIVTGLALSVVVVRAEGFSEPGATSSAEAGTPFASTGTPQIKRPPVIFDSFDGPAGAAPNPDKWTVSEGTGWDKGIENYTSGNAVLDGQGRLVLQAHRTGDGYTSGRIETKDKASFGYGTLIARIKVPSGTGLWPAFFLGGADENSNPWPGAGEIDVVELVSDPRTAYSSIHGPISGVADYLQDQIIVKGPDLSADFHDYWVTYSENSISTGVDDIVWGAFTPESLPPSAQWVYNKPFYAVLKLAVGGDWAGPPDDSTQFPATMLVEYLHWEPA